MAENLSPTACVCVACGRHGCTNDPGLCAYYDKDSGSIRGRDSTQGWADDRGCGRADSSGSEHTQEVLRRECVRGVETNPGDGNCMFWGFIRHFTLQ